METARGGVADVHTRPFADVLQVGEMLQILGRVSLTVAGRLGGFIVFLFVGHLVRSCLLLVIQKDSPRRAQRTQRRIRSCFLLISFVCALCVLRGENNCFVVYPMLPMR